MTTLPALFGIVDAVLQTVFLGVGLWAGVIKEDWPRGTFWIAMSIVAVLS